MIKLNRIGGSLPWLVALLLCAFPVRNYTLCLNEACAHVEVSLAPCGSACEGKAHCLQCMARDCQSQEAPELAFPGKRLVSLAWVPAPEPSAWTNPFLLHSMPIPATSWPRGSTTHLLLLASVQLLC